MKNTLKNTKKALALLFVAGALTSTAFALDCKDMMGSWKGELGDLKNVTFDISQLLQDQTSNSADQEQGLKEIHSTIKFTDKEGKERSIEFKDGHCVQLPLQKPRLELHRIAGDISADLLAELKEKNEVKVNSFNYNIEGSSGSGSGSLSRG